MQIFLIFNYSIDAPDPMGDSVREDLSVNDIESITELVLEYGLGLENFVPEHDEDDPDEKSGLTKKIDAHQITHQFQLCTDFLVYQNYCRHHYTYSLKVPSFELVKDLTDPPEA